MNLKSLFSNMSDMRKRYALRLAGRLLILGIGFLFCIFDPSQFNVLQGMNFFDHFTWLHLLWGIWVIDMPPSSSRSELKFPWAHRSCGRCAFNP